MKKNKILHVRISSEQFQEMQNAIAKLNEEGTLEFAQQDFFRLAIKQFSQRIASGELSFILKVAKNEKRTH